MSIFRLTFGVTNHQVQPGHFTDGKTEVQRDNGGCMFVVLSLLLLSLLLLLLL